MAEVDDPSTVVSAAAGPVVETIDDDNDNDNDGDDAGPVIAEEQAVIETARAQAEARRKRILEKANNRMKYVNGEQTQNGEEKKTSLSNAARIRAARQRRYGKKSAAATATAATPSATTATEITNEAADGASAEPESKIEETKESAAETTTSTSTTETSEAKKEESDDKEKIPLEELVVEKQPVEGNTAAAVSEENSGEEAPAAAETKKKKYVGVARMRRKMLAKKKMDTTGSTTATASVATGGKTAKAATTDTSISVGKAVLAPVKLQTIPIYMHMVVILLMFVAGFDVGIQQFHVEVDVRTQVAVQEYGMPFLHRNPWHPLTPMIATDGSTENETLEEKLSSTSKTSSSSGGGLQDEFQEIDEEYIPPNIDPIFGTDLDELTKGPGFLNQMARGAIAIHRLVLWILYYAPMSFFSSIISIPTALIQSPPGLFMIAIMLRQVVGKMMLGATIPPESNSGGKKQNNIEVLSMAKNFVKNFFVTTFPTLVTLYDAYLHLKSDMYVVLCGVFFGLAWTHLFNDATCDADSIMSGGGDAHGGEL